MAGLGKPGRKMKPRGKCLVCGALLEGKPLDTKYCSRTCAGIGHRRNAVCICKECGAEFLPKVKDHTTFCSWVCTKEWMDAHKAPKAAEPKLTDYPQGAQVTALCPICGASFTYIRGRGAPKKYCSRRCNVRAFGRRGSSVRRARKFGASTCEHLNAFDVFERDGWTCALCGQPVDKVLLWPDRLSASLDHIIPLSRGGKHVPANVQCSHLECNMTKGARGGPPDSLGPWT